MKEVHCDRRLSRAARHILRRHVAQALGLPKEDDAAESSSHRPLVDETLSSCPLWKDDYLEEDANAMEIPSQPSRDATVTAIHGRWLKYGVQPTWWQCRVCGKVFSTRYYLDVHLQTKHSHDDDHSACPAAWCRFLPFCDDVAMELEPYYAPGSGGFGPDQYAVKRKLQKQVPACRQAQMEEGRNECFKMIETCFENATLRQRLNETLCASFSCSHRIHRLFDESLLKTVHDFRHEWIVHVEKHELGYIGAAVFVCILLFAVMAWLNSRPIQPFGRHNGARLLRRSSFQRSSLLKKKQS